MSDLIALAAVTLLFAVALAYVSGCDRIIGSKHHG